MSVLPYGCTTWTLTKCLGEKVRWELYEDAVCYFERVLEAAPEKKTKKKQHLFSYLPHITQTI